MADSDRVMGLVDTFREEVEDYIALTGEAPTKFGAAVIGDPSFVFDLRAGRAPRADTIDRVRAYIAAKKAEASEPAT